MHKMSPKTVREILPNQIINHYIDPKNIQWVSYSDKNNTYKVRHNSGYIDEWHYSKKGWRIQKQTRWILA
jgi:hypothetical protein